MAPGLPKTLQAALVILALDEAVSASLLAGLEEDELRRLADAVDELGDVPHEMVMTVMKEFELALNAPMVVGNRGKYMYKLAANALGRDCAQRLFTDDPGPKSAIDAIAEVRPSAVAEVLDDEHPQVAAAILSRLPARRAAEVVGHMEQEAQTEILGRLATVELVADSAIHGAADALLASLADVGGGASGGDENAFDGIQFAASVLNEMDPEESLRILEDLDCNDEDTADSIRAAMFVFEDLVRLDDRSLQLLMREISSDQLVVALHAADEGVRETLLSAISSRAALTIREDLEMMQPRRLSEVEAARREVVDAAMSMASEGRIQMPTRDEEMV